MPVILDVRVSTPHPQRHPHPHPTRIRRQGYHHPDDRRLLHRSPCAEHGACTPASGSVTGGYGRGGSSVCRTAGAPRPLSAGINPLCLRNDSRGESHQHRRPAPNGLAERRRGGHLDRPTLERWRQDAPPGEFTAGVGVSPAPLARHAATPWRWLEAVDPQQTLQRWPHHPGGDTPPGQRLTPWPGRRAASAGAQHLERTRRRRLAAGQRGGGIAATPRPSSTDRHQRPATPCALGRRQEETP
jgi:hypothetical protein